MTILLVILLVLLTIVAWRRQQSPSRVLNAVLVVLVVACLGVAVVVWRQPHLEEARWIARANRVPEAIAFELGRAVAQAFPQGGDVLVLLPGLPAKFPSDGIGAVQVKALQAGFGRAKLHAVAVGYTAASDNEAMEMQAEWPRFGVPIAKVSEWVAKHSGAVAVATFVFVGPGPAGQPAPSMPPLFMGEVPAVEPRFGTTETWLGWVKPGGLEGVIVKRSAFNLEKISVQSSLPEVFEQCCELITPANVAAARDRLNGGNP